jgi:hypothetical protein
MWKCLFWLQLAKKLRKWNRRECGCTCSYKGVTRVNFIRYFRECTQTPWNTIAFPQEYCTSHQVKSLVYPDNLAPWCEPALWCLSQHNQPDTAMWKVYHNCVFALHTYCARPKTG